MFSQVSTVEQGLIDIDFKRLHESLVKHEGKQVRLSCEKWNPTKTKEQLGYYYAAIAQPFGDHYGYTKDEASEVLRQECMLSKVVTINKEEYVIRPRVSSLKRSEMSEYISRCIQWLAEQDFRIQTPEEYWGI